MTYPTEIENYRAITGAINTWLGERQNGYADLHRATKSLLAFFMPVWSVFEGQALSTNANQQSIREYVNQNVPENADIRRLQPALDFFTDRYVEGARTNRRFTSLVGNRTDIARDLTSVLLGQTVLTREKVICLLLIVYCLRNNMAHGLKWQWGYADQYESIVHAVHVLMRTLDGFPPLS